MRVCTFGCSNEQIGEIEAHFAGVPIQHVSGDDAQGWARCVGVVLPMVSVDTGCSSLWLSVERALRYSSGSTPSIEHDVERSGVGQQDVDKAAEASQVEREVQTRIERGEHVQTARAVSEGLKGRGEVISQIDARKADLLGKAERSERTHKRQMDVKKEGERRERI